MITLLLGVLLQSRCFVFNIGHSNVVKIIYDCVRSLMLAPLVSIKRKFLSQVNGSFNQLYVFLRFCNLYLFAILFLFHNVSSCALRSISNKPPVSLK
jgi:hypothetical protein